MGPLRLDPPDRCAAAPAPPPRLTWPEAATLICVLMVAASRAEYHWLVSPRLARRLAMETQRSSRSFIMESTGAAMKIDE